MNIKVHLQSEAVPILRQMAQEAGLSLPDMAEVAIYALIGSWQRDRGVGTQPLDSDQPVADTDKLACN